ncbi:MAG: cytochrome ubiquinol oxidase subunit I [Rhodobacterales bacterium]|nr:cytochrome ubiquinol oxidase subunit I [Rhodobacterales bacterium]
MWTNLLAARAQMGFSLGFHMIFAVAGIGMPLLMVLAEALWLRTGDELWLILAKRWAKGTAILFAVGAVSGTVLSFELGLLWPEFMRFAGPIIGMPFSLEGFAFFFEAIFLGIYLYGWERTSRTAHFLAGVGVWLSGTASAIFVVTANAWMNTPAGFTLAADGTVLDVDPIAAMMNPSAFGQTLHMTVAAFVATAWMAAGVHAWMLLKDRDNRFQQRGLMLALGLAAVVTVLQPLTGHVVAEAVAHNQPVKLAALEAQWETQTNAPFTLGGWPDEAAEETRYAIHIPGLLSYLSYGSVDAEVMGLSDVPPENRPPVAVTHIAYQVMLATAGVMGLTAGVGGLLLIARRRLPLDRWYLRMVLATSPMGILGVEAGWIATEVGRQPWVVTGYLRTADAVTPIQGISYHFLAFTLLYFALGIITVYLLRRQFLHSPVIHQEVPDDA